MAFTKMCCLPYESIFSYLLRFGNKNYISLLEVWGHCNLAKAHPSMQNINILNHCPTGILNIDTLSSIIGQSCDKVLNMSFYNLLKKFECNDKISKSNIMIGLLHTCYHYCPMCLSECPHHQLLWSINKIEICKKHRIRLQQKCVHCKQIIKLNDVVDFLYCPYCGGSLKNSKKQPEKLSPHYFHEQEWLVKSFTYLLTRNDVQINRKEFAIKLLYLLNERRPKYDRNRVIENLNEDVNLSMLLQHARESLSRNKHFNLASALDIIYKANCSLAEFFSMNVLKEFYESLFIIRLMKMTCYAPWCNVRGRLRKSSNSRSKNRIRYYLTCNGCGCKYGVDQNDTLVERTNFISLYSYLSTIEEQTISIKQMSRVWGLSFGRILRAIAYFDSRGVFRFDNYHIELDELKLSRFLTALESDMSFDDIRFSNHWNSFYEYLYYRYHDEVIKAELARLK